MNRPIKFRCFYRDKMYDVKEIQFFDDGSFLVSEIIFDLDGDGVLRSIFPDSEHIKGIMQFTGLTDRNGKEIWESDLIKIKNCECVGHDENENEIWQPCEGVVTFEDGMFVFDGHSAGALPLYAYIGEIEVIGDIYTTPELLNK